MENTRAERELKETPAAATWVYQRAHFYEGTDLAHKLKMGPLVDGFGWDLEEVALFYTLIRIIKLSHPNVQRVREMSIKLFHVTIGEAQV